MNAEQLIKKYENNCELIEFWTNNSKNETIIHENKKLKSYIKSSSSGISARVLLKGCYGFASTNNEKNAEKTLKTAIKLAKNFSKLKKNKTKLKDFEINKKNFKQKIKKNPFLIQEKEKISFLKDFNNSFDFKEIKNNETTISFSQKNSQYINSKKSNVKQEVYYAQLYNELIAGNPIENIRSIRRAKTGYELLNFNYEKFAKKSSEKIKQLINSKQAKPGKYDVILDPEICGTFFHEAIGHALEADALKEKSTCVSLGEQISTEELNLYDNPTLKNYWGSYEYDDEGIKAKKNPLIIKGKIINFINDLPNYFELNGLKKTANARMQSIHDCPIPRMSNTQVKKGNYSTQELIEKKKNGILLKGFGGGAVEPLTGIFSFKAVQAFIIKNGKITTPCKGASLSGDLKQVLKNITGIGKEITNTFSGGMCGKKSQSVPVSESVPHISVRNINVTN